MHSRTDEDKWNEGIGYVFWAAVSWQRRFEQTRRCSGENVKVLLQDAVTVVQPTEYKCSDQRLEHGHDTFESTLNFSFVSCRIVTLYAVSSAETANGMRCILSSLGKVGIDERFCCDGAMSSLEERRHRADLLEVFRMYKGLSLTPFCRYFRLSHVNNTTILEVTQPRF